jgi:GYF domain 2
MGEPYREKGERPPIPPGLRRWFTKSGDLEKGPFDEKALLASLKNGLIKSTTLVRGEGDVQWQRIGDVKELAPKTAPIAFRSDFDPRRNGAVENEGSFGAGFAAGFFGGILGMILVLAMAKGPATKQGARIGFVVQIFIGVLVRVMLRQG